MLGNLTSRELACAASTSRDFQGAYRNWLTEEGARQVSVAEDTFGKERLSGLVRAFQRLMSDMKTYPGLLANRKNLLVINAAGEPELATNEQAKERRNAEGGIHSICKWSRTYLLHANLKCRVPASGRVAHLWMDLRRTREGNVHLVVTVNDAAHGAGVGLILAMCTGIPSASWRWPLFTTVLQFRGAGALCKREAYDLAAPLRPLAESVMWCSDPNGYPHVLGGNHLEEDHPLGHLQLICQRSHSMMDVQWV